MKWMPARSVRLRLTLVSMALLIVSGAAMLAIVYVLVGHGTDPTFRTTDHVALITGPVGSSGEPSPTITPTSQLNREILAQIQAASLRQHTALINSLVRNSAIALLATAVAALVLSWLAAGRVLRPLREITNTVRDISATDLHKRLALSGPRDELTQLGDTFDGLLARLESTFESQRQFIANASHELRSPLARQRTIGQVALSDPDATVESLRAAHERVVAAGRQQERTIEALLALARGQSGIEHASEVDVSEIVGDVLRTSAARADAEGLTLTSSLGDARIAGDPQLVDRLVSNLLGNALAYNVPGGTIEVATTAHRDRVVLVVTNTGPVIPDDAIERLVQPLRRLDEGRTHGDGLGLGLSIVKAISDAHHATLSLNPRVGGGLRVQVDFPSARIPRI